MSIDTKVFVPALKQEALSVNIEGISPLIFHKWSEKAKKQIRDKQQKVASTGREKRNPEQECKDSYYYNDKGEIAFPASSLKKSIINAGRFSDEFPMTIIRGALFVMGDSDGLIKVNYKEKDKNMREDMVRVGRGAADLRYRGELKKWNMEVQITYNSAVISKEQVLTLLKTAGFSVGIGEWRPEKNGDYGRFELKK